VQTECGFVLHDSHEEWEASIKVNDEISLTSSEQILRELAKGNRPDNFRIALGYAGWAPGQLEAELQANAWLTVRYQKDLVFNTSADKQWLTAGKLLGVDLNLLISGAGHA
jgi:putative transcriptional regulator